MARTAVTSLSPSKAAAIAVAAGRLGITPAQLTAIISNETMGTFSPSIWGGSDKNGDGKPDYFGIAQFGADERAQFDVSTKNPDFNAQLNSLVDFAIARGFVPGEMTAQSLYTTILGGNPYANPNIKSGDLTIAQWNAVVFSNPNLSKMTGILGDYSMMAGLSAPYSNPTNPQMAAMALGMPGTAVASNASMSEGAASPTGSWTNATPVNTWTSMPGTDLSGYALGTPSTGSAASSAAAAAAMSGMYGPTATAAPSYAGPVGQTGGFTPADPSSISKGPYGAEAVVSAALAGSTKGVAQAWSSMVSAAKADIGFIGLISGKASEAKAAITNYFANLAKTNPAVADAVARNAIMNPSLLDGITDPAAKASFVEGLNSLGVAGRDVATLMATGDYTGGRPATAAKTSTPSPGQISSIIGGSPSMASIYGAGAPSIGTYGVAPAASVYSSGGPSTGTYGSSTAYSPASSGGLSPSMYGGPGTSGASAQSPSYYGGGLGPSSSPAPSASYSSGAASPSGKTFSPQAQVASLYGSSANQNSIPSLGATTFTPAAKATPDSVVSSVPSTSVVANPAYAAAVAQNAAAAAAAKGPPADADIANSIALASLISNSNYTGKPATKVPAKVPLPPKTITVQNKAKAVANSPQAGLSAPAAVAMVGGHPVTGYTPVGGVPYSAQIGGGIGYGTNAGGGANASVYGMAPGGTSTTYGTSNGGSISMYSAPSASYNTSTGNASGRSVVTGSTSGSGGAAGGTVLCTYYYRKGWLPRAIWKADLCYGMKCPPAMLAGYYLWAIPMVESMKRGNPVLEKIMWPIVREWATETAYRAGVVPKGSLAGKIVRLVLEPLCYIAGSIAGSDLRVKA